MAIKKASSSKGKGKGFGSVRKLPSGNIQAYYVFDYQKVTAPNTFKTMADARYWLLQEELATKNGTWISPTLRNQTASEFEFVAYSEHYMRVKRTRQAKPIEESTKDLYRKSVNNQLRQFHGKDIRKISESDVITWHIQETAKGKLTATANSYKLLRAMMNQLIRDKQVKSNPCQIAGAQSGQTGRREYTPTLAEVNALAKTMEPDFRILTLLGAYGVMRFGELAGLQKGDFRRLQDKDSGAYYEVSIQRQVKYYDRHFEVGPPKSKWGIRTNVLSPSLTPQLDAYLSGIAEPSDHLFRHSSGSFLRNDHYEHRMKKGVESIGLGGKGFHVHSLRHAGATAWANTGANVEEIQRILGDSSPRAALGYIRSTGRFVALASALPAVY